MSPARHRAHGRPGDIRPWPRQLTTGFTVWMMLLLVINQQQQVSGNTWSPPCHRHLPAGSGYFVSENYPFEYPQYINCRYDIPVPQYATAVCFRFHRFLLSGNDRLEIRGKPWQQDQAQAQAPADGYWYSHEGTLIQMSQLVFPNVWVANFCWVADDTLQMVFRASSSVRDLGFYATYKTVAIETLQPRNMSEGPGQCIAVCYDRHCRVGDACPSKHTQTGCADVSDQSYAHSKCTTANNEPVHQPGQLACDFDRKGCGSLWLGQRMWDPVRGSRDTVYGPSSDHTTQDGDAYYMVRDFSNLRASTMSDIEVVVVAPPGAETTTCLSFWYHMNGHDVGRLEIFHEVYNVRGATLWSREGSYGNYWHHGHISLSTKGNSTLGFSATRGSEYRSQIAIDDLSVMKGPCPYYDDVSCTFSGNLCGWVSNGGFTMDCNSNIQHHCRTVHCRANSRGKNCALVSPSIAIGGASCLVISFRFGSHGQKGHLEVTPGRPARVLGARTVANWPVAKFDIPSSKEAYKIKIQTHLATGNYIDINEINFVPVKCDEIDVGSCQRDQFRCRRTGKCVSLRARCNTLNECGEDDDSDEAQCAHPARGCSPMFKCGNNVCVEYSVRCNGFDDCGDRSDENNCNKNNDQDAFSGYSPVALIALVAGCLLILLILFIKIALCLHKKWKVRRLARLRERRLEALRSRGRCNSIESLTIQYQPPSYDDCVRDNPAFVLGEESVEEGDKRDLPSYSQVIDGGYMMITNPVVAQLQRLRQHMQERLQGGGAGESVTEGPPSGDTGQHEAVPQTQSQSAVGPAEHIVESASVETVTDQGTSVETVTDQGTSVETVTDQGTSVETVTDQGTSVETVTDQGTSIETMTDQGTSIETVTDQGTSRETVTDQGTSVETVTDQGTSIETVTDQGTSIETITDQGTSRETVTDPGTSIETINEVQTANERAQSNNVDYENPFYSTQTPAVTGVPHPSSQQGTNGHINETQGEVNQGAILPTETLHLPHDRPTPREFTDAQTGELQSPQLRTDYIPQTDSTGHSVLGDPQKQARVASWDPGLSGGKIDSGSLDPGTYAAIRGNAPSPLPLLLPTVSLAVWDNSEIQV